MSTTKEYIDSKTDRCNDYACPTRAFCARSRQLLTDFKTGRKNMPVKDFGGRDIRRLCSHFLNADID